MILVVIAMVDEAKDILPHLNKIEHAPFDVYNGIIAGKEINLVVCGIGKVNAACATTYMLSKYQVKTIINLGLAGASKLDLGESYLVEHCTYHDFDLTFFGYEKGQVPKHPPLFYSKHIKLPIKNAILYTGDYFALNPIKDQAYLVDMEACAIYQTAYKFHVDVIAVKTVSDLIGDISQQEQLKHAEVNYGKIIHQNLIVILDKLPEYSANIDSKYGG